MVIFFTNGTIGEGFLTIGICLCILGMCGVLWATLGRLLRLLSTLFRPAVERQDGGWWCMCLYMNFVSYHVGNKSETNCSNPTFCDKGLDVKVGNVWGLNHNYSDGSHLLVGMVKSLKSQVFHNRVCQSNASFVRVPASLNLCLPQISGWSI